MGINAYVSIKLRNDCNNAEKVVSEIMALDRVVFADMTEELKIVAIIEGESMTEISDLLSNSIDIMDSVDKSVVCLATKIDSSG